MGESAVAERVGAVQEQVYAPLISLARRSPLHSGVLGHWLHPSLTDVTIGCWLGASVVDLVGGPGANRAADTLAALGLVVAVPTALAGAADWSETSGAPYRIGAVHAVGTDIATFLFVVSVAARLRGGRVTGVRCAVLGNLVMAGAGVLGGHLALNRGVARRSGSVGQDV